MKGMYGTIMVLAALLFAGAGGAAETDTLAAPEDGHLVAIVGATVIPMDSDRTLPGYTVVVEDDRIVSVGPEGEVDIPSGATVVDGNGRFLIPGFAEMHGHIPPPSGSAEYIENVLFLYVSNGVTTVRGMLGHPGQLELKERVLSGDLTGPSLYLAGPGFSGQSVRSPEEAERKARGQAAEGWDLIKVYPGLSRETYDRMAETAREIGMRFAGHVPEDVGLLHALEMGQETFDHLDGYTEYLGAEEREVPDEDLREIARKTKEAGALVVPTMALWETLWGIAEPEALAAYDELKYMPQSEVRSWADRYRELRSGAEKVTSARIIDTRMRLLKVLQEEGVGILFGTDAPQLYSVPGFSIHRETPRMLEAGLTPYEILVSATRNVGEYFSNEVDFGTIEVGKRADMVLLASNPLEDISSLREIEGVVLRGRWLPASEIDERLEQIGRSYQ